MSKRSNGRGTVYKRGALFWIAYRVEGERFHESATTGDRRAALAFLAERLREIADGTWKPPTERTTSARRTVASDWKDWLKTRDDVKTYADDVAVGERYIIPFFGELATRHVSTAHVLDFHAELRRKISGRGKPLSKNYMRNIDARLVTFFADMEQRGRIPRTPYAGLRKSQRLKRAMRHEITANKRVFTRKEIEALIYDDRIADDRRVFYALQFFTGTRFGEAAGLRWFDLEHEHEPLAMLSVERQYADQPLKGKRNEPGVPRTVPVHAQLATILAEWKLSGFPLMLMRHAKPEDFIVPSRTGACRSLRHMGRKLSEDLERLKLVKTEQTHAFRRGFKTIAVANGAAEVWIERVIHNASGGVADGYLADDWPAMCRAVSCIPISRPELAKVIELHPNKSGSG